MYALRFITSRLIKIFANVFKGVCYVFHFLFPGKRFTIPEYAPPLFGKQKNDGVARTVWQTNFTDKVTLPIYVNYLFNRLMAPGYEFRFLVTEARTRVIEENYPKDVFNAYSRLLVGAAQADVWRVLTLWGNGGVYMDIDAHLVWPLGLIVRPGHDELYLKGRDGIITNYFIAGRKGSPALKAIAEQIVENIGNPKDNDIFNITGPQVFADVLAGREIETVNYRITCHQGNFTNVFFQYIDKEEGKWVDVQLTNKVIRD